MMIFFFHTHSCLVLKLLGVLMCIQCRDELNVVGGSACGGKICCLKPAEPVKLHHGNPQLI